MNIDKIMNSKKYYYFLVGYLILTLTVSLIGFGFLPNGQRVFTNREVSMEPLISSHSLTIVKPFPSYEVGDIISYYDLVNNEEVIVTHRVIKIGGNVYVTKGDNNEATDARVVRPRLIIGKVVVIVPWIGLIFSIIKHPLGVGMFILLPALMIMILEIHRIEKLVS